MQLPAVELFDIYPREMKTCSHSDLYMIVCSSFISNVQLETTQMPFNGQMVKKTVVRSYHGILLSNKQNELLIEATTWVNLQIIM